jgi:hypothetical protein
VVADRSRRDLAQGGDAARGPDDDEVADEGEIALVDAARPGVGEQAG